MGYKVVNLQENKQVMANRFQLPFRCKAFDSDVVNKEMEGDLISIHKILALVLCTEGSITAQIDKNTYLINKGDVLFISPSIYAHITSISPDLRGIILYVDHDFIMSIINRAMDIRSALHFSEHPYMSLTVSQFDIVRSEMQALMQRVEKENESDAGAARGIVLYELLVSMCRTLIYELINFYLQGHHLQLGEWSGSDKIVQNFILEVYNHYRKHREVAFYADLLCVTPSYLSNLVKEKTGKPALQWIIDTVISDARQLLLYTDMPIKEIIVTLGFSNQSFFGKYFKQYVGKSPKLFRQEGRRSPSAFLHSNA